MRKPRTPTPALGTAMGAAFRLRQQDPPLPLWSLGRFQAQEALYTALCGTAPRYPVPGPLPGPFPLPDLDLYSGGRSFLLTSRIGEGAQADGAIVGVLADEGVLPQTQAFLRSAGQGLSRLLLLLWDGPSGPDPASAQRALDALLSCGFAGKEITLIRAGKGGPFLAQLHGALREMPPPALPMNSALTPTEPDALSALILGKLRRLVRPSSRLRLVRRPAAQLFAAGIGTHCGGMPYLAAGREWPRCRPCHVPLRFLWQVDHRAGFHDKLEGAGLYTLYRCPDCKQSDIQHHPDPRPELRQPMQATDLPEAYGVELSRVLRLPSWEDLQLRHPEIAQLLRRLEPRGYRAYANAHDRLGALWHDPAPHIGGYPKGQVPAMSPACELCGQPMALVFSPGEQDLLATGSGNALLFTCSCAPDHVVSYGREG